MSTLHWFIFIEALIVFGVNTAQSQSLPSPTTSTLRLVQVIIRHGDRAPNNPYPNDLYKNQSLYWPEGWGQLTKIGVKQESELGKYLRGRYNGFLPSTYRREDILVESSDADRTIQSAEASLGQLYIKPPTLIPIHTIPSEMDIWINPEVSCPRYTALLQAMYSSPEILALDQENQDFIQFISDKAGLTEVRTVTQLGQVQDALHSEKAHNLTLPDWATDEVVNKLDGFKALSFRWKVETLGQKRLLAGPMLGKLMDNFKSPDEMSEGISKGPLRKMYFYSGHDITLGSVMGTLGLFEPHLPPYAAALMMELHQSPDIAQPYIEVYYRNDTSREPYRLEIPGCGPPCTLSQLQDISSQYIPTDWYGECKSGLLSLSANPPNQQELGPSVPGLLGLGAGVALVGAIVGSALYSVQRLRGGRSSFVQSPLGVNSYETLP